MHIISLGLVQLYSIPIPVYGPHHYTTFEKKLNVETNEQSGSGPSDNQTETELKSEAEPPKVSDSVLDKLNEKKKLKLDSSIYSSFLHPNQIETSSISIGAKRKPSKTASGSGFEEVIREDEMKKRKTSEPKHKFHLI